jgi:hypothetical protein
VSAFGGSNASDALVEDLPDLDDVVRELRQLYCVSGLRLSVSIGKLVLDRLYGGDVALWHSRGRKDNSFRRLAQHPELPFSAPTLSRSVGIYLISLRRRDLLELANVGPTHVRQLLSLSSEVQDRLIDQAAEHDWSVQRLQQEIRCLQSPDPKRFETKRDLPLFARYVRRLRRGIDTRALLQGTEHVDQLTPKEAEELLETVRRLCKQAETVARYLAENLAKRTHADGAPREFARPTAHQSGVVAPIVSPPNHARLRVGRRA